MLLMTCCLRRFPVWFDFRGNSSVLLSEAKAVSLAARLRGDLEAADLAQKQAEWLVGRNPFAASVMYGEGYDWTPLYSVRSGQMVGALPSASRPRDSTTLLTGPIKFAGRIKRFGPNPWASGYG